MELLLIRNATLKIEYAGHVLLFDPYFAHKQSLPSYTGASQNPMVDLPMPMQDILDGVECVIVSHLHTDHFDTVAQENIPKDLPVLCQPENASTISEKGFIDVHPIPESLEWHGITITRVRGHHGLGDVEKLMGTVSGFILEAESEPTVYLCGDTVICDEVSETIKTHQPRIIVTHSSGAQWKIDDTPHLIVMDAVQTVAVAESAPESTVVAVHMETLDHGTVSREDIRTLARSRGISARVLVPEDGEKLAL